MFLREAYLNAPFDIALCVGHGYQCMLTCIVWHSCSMWAVFVERSLVAIYSRALESVRCGYVMVAIFFVCAELLGEAM